jgi:hypothetical protein
MRWGGGVVTALLLVTAASAGTAAVGWIGGYLGLAFNEVRFRNRIARDATRLHGTLRTSPEQVVEIAFPRRGLVIVGLLDGTRIPLRFDVARTESVVALLAERCPHATVHQGSPQYRVGDAPVARLLERK